MPVPPEWSGSWGVWIEKSDTRALEVWVGQVTRDILRGETHTDDARRIPLADVLEWYVEELERREKDEAR